MARLVPKEAPFALLVRDTRIAAKMTQADLADAVGCPQQTIEKIERGVTKSSGYMPRIFSRLGIDLNILVQRPIAEQTAKKVDRPRKLPPRKVYLREWRKFMKADVGALAKIAGGDAGGYEYLEQYPYKLSLEQLANLSSEIGISPDQIWFPPNKKSEGA